MVIDQNDNSDKKQMYLSDILTKDELDAIRKAEQNKKKRGY